MAKDRENLRDNVILITRRSDKTDLINLGLDFGLLSVAREHNFKVMKTTSDLSASEDDIVEALPSDFLDLREVRLINDTSSYALRVRDEKWVTDRWPNRAADASRKPDYVFSDGTNIGFDAPLDADYTVRITYYTLPTFVDDDTTNPIPLAEDAIVYFATEFLYNSMEMKERGLYWKTMGEIALAKAVARDKVESAEIKKFEEFTSDRDISLTKDDFIVPDEV